MTEKKDEMAIVAVGNMHGMSELTLRFPGVLLRCSEDDCRVYAELLGRPVVLLAADDPRLRAGHHPQCKHPDAHVQCSCALLELTELRASLGSARKELALLRGSDGSWVRVATDLDLVPRETKT